MSVLTYESALLSERPRGKDHQVLLEDKFLDDACAWEI